MNKLTTTEDEALILFDELTLDGNFDFKPLRRLFSQMIQSAISQGEQKGKVDTAREITERIYKRLREVRDLPNQSAGSALLNIGSTLSDIKAKYLTTEKETDEICGTEHTTKPFDKEKFLKLAKAVNIDECPCHCHHTPKHIGQLGYGMAPNWAECSRNCERECIHCSVTEREGK